MRGRGRIGPEGGAGGQAPRHGSLEPLERLERREAQGAPGQVRIALSRKGKVLGHVLKRGGEPVWRAGSDLSLTLFGAGGPVPSARDVDDLVNGIEAVVFADRRRTDGVEWV